MAEFGESGRVSSEESRAGHEILLVESRRHLDALVDSFRDLDTKAIEIAKVSGVLLTIALTGAGVLARIVPEMPREVVEGEWGRALFASYALGTLGLIVSLFLAVLGYGRVNVRIGITKLDKEARREIPAARVMRDLIDVYAKAIEADRRSLHWKGQYVDWSLICVALSALLLLLAASGLSLAGGLGAQHA